MALTDTFTKQVKHTGKASGDKYADGDSMHLLVKAGGKYWRMDCRFADKRKTLALGIYPEVSLTKARQRRVKARELLSDGVDPGAAKKEATLAKASAARSTRTTKPMPCSTRWKKSKRVCGPRSSIRFGSSSVSLALSR
jgi:hypothetical protein